MQGRTDLALEQKELHRSLPPGVDCVELQKGDAIITKITVKNEAGAVSLKKPIGRYTTIELPTFSDNLNNEEIMKTSAEALMELIPETGSALIVGLGNRQITPDALGPKSAGDILATGHISTELKRVAGIDEIRDVYVLSPGVLGQTGVEVFDLLKALTNQIHPDFLIVIDALASRNLSRLGCTLQMSDTGIEPGAGVGNARREISKKALGLPVIAVGVPTVVDAATLVFDLTGQKFHPDFPRDEQLIVTPREIDLLINRAANLISETVNRALHPKINPEIIRELLA